MAVLENNTAKEQEKGQQWKDDYEDDEAEALSLCDLPIDGHGNCESNESSSSNCLVFEAEDFEFGSWIEDPVLMCAADDVFFQGQILPLRPSVSSESGFLSGFRPDSQKSSCCGSRTNSMGRSSGNGSCVFSSSSDRSISIGSSSNRSSSRSHSLSSSSSTYNFYMHPSPKPQMGNQLRRNAAKTGRRSSGWGLFRLGLVRTPEIELHDLRLRKRNSISGRKCNKNESRSNSGRKSCSSDGNDGVKLLEKKGGEGQGLQRFFRGGLNCKCSADAVDTVSSRIVIMKSRKEVGDAGCGKQVVSQRRTFEWLKELSIAEAPVA